MTRQDLEDKREALLQIKMRKFKEYSDFKKLAGEKLSEYLACNTSVDLCDRLIAEYDRQSAIEGSA